MYTIVKIYDDDNQLIREKRLEPYDVREEGMTIVNEFRFKFYQVNEEMIRKQAESEDKHGSI